MTKLSLNNFEFKFIFLNEKKLFLNMETFIRILKISIYRHINDFSEYCSFTLLRWFKILKILTRLQTHSRNYILLLHRKLYMYRTSDTFSKPSYISLRILKQWISCEKEHPGNIITHYPHYIHVELPLSPIKIIQRHTSYSLHIKGIWWTMRLNGILNFFLNI